MNVISRGIRNAFRNGIRSVAIIAILGLSIGLALTMLIANQAVRQKITSVKSSVGNTISISPAGLRGFEGGGNALTADQLTKVAALPHVSKLDESLSDRLTTTNTSLQSAVEAGNLGQRFADNNGTTIRPEGNFTPNTTTGGGSAGSGFTRSFTPTVTVVGTTAPTELSTSLGGGSFSLKSGQVFATDSQANVALLGTTLAQKNNLPVGSTFTAYGATVSVVGIFDAGNTFSNNQVIMPLKTLQTLSSQAGAVTAATATIDSATNLDSVTTAITSTLGSAADVTNSSQQVQQTLAPLENIQSISLYSLIGAVIAGAVIVLLTMVMIVRERRREIGVTKAIGASNLKVVVQFMSEAVTLTVLAAVIGIIIGVLAGNPITHMLVSNASTSSSQTVTVAGGARLSVARSVGRGFTQLGNSVTNIQANIGWIVIVEGLVAAVVIAVVGSAAAAFLIAKVRPSEVLRAE